MPLNHFILSAASLFLAGGGVASAISVTGLAGSNLVTFDSATPGVFSNSVAVSGLTAGDSLVAIDYRPADGRLIGVGYNSAAGTARVYTLDTSTGLATSINLNTLSIGTGLSQVTADFNPTANAIRVVTSSGTGNNLRITMAGAGALALDSDLNPGPASIRATAYSFNVAGGGASGRTTLYEINGNNLVSQGSVDFFTGSGTSPNTGTLTTIAALSGINGANVVDLDIYSTSASDPGTAYISDGAAFYTLNLATGQATSLGNLQSGITDFAIIPEPSAAILVAGATLGAAGLRRRRMVR